jgi:hypothetical protein
MQDEDKELEKKRDCGYEGPPVLKKREAKNEDSENKALNIKSDFLV